MAALSEADAAWNRGKATEDGTAFGRARSIQVRALPGERSIVPDEPERMELQMTSPSVSREVPPVAATPGKTIDS
ncbi:MAG: hypothetical protein HY526_12215 [Betaproteobacteria bacterium]|nr:hypothetical protein [Betaproteobacteria bacterium]